VQRAFHLLDELGDPIQGKPGLEITEVAGMYLERLALRRNASACQPAAQRLVDDLAEGSARPARFRLELGRHIVVQGERRSHFFDAMVQAS